jgi:hypothetical protein
MGKIETLILRAIIAVMVPLTLFLAGWFISAALFLYEVISIPETAILIVAFCGLGLGILFDVACLKRWVRKAYCLNLRLLSLLYLFYAIVTLAFFMGVPIVNVGLGVIAGVYVGRRCHHLGAKPKHFQQEVKKVSLFTAWVMGFVAIISGAIAISDPWTPANLQGMFNITSFIITPEMIIGLVIVGAPLLVVLQYWLAKFAAIFAFNLNQHRPVTDA